MGKMVDQQSEFLQNICYLIHIAHRMGYQVTPGCFYCVDRKHHKEGSFHYKRLAADLNLFKDGKYLTDTEDHAVLGKIWKTMGGTWGGDFSNPDGNHYSWGE